MAKKTRSKAATSRSAKQRRKEQTGEGIEKRLERRQRGMEQEAEQWAQESESLEATRYPLVFAHGAGGAGAFGLLDYFFEVEATLEAQGYVAFAPSVAAMAHSDVRAQEFATATDVILADTGASKVHLLGHSQAGLDFRVLLGGLGYGGRVATATSMSTPHAGYRPGLSVGSEWFGMRTDADYLTGEFVAL